MRWRKKKKKNFFSFSNSYEDLNILQKLQIYSTPFFLADRLAEVLLQRDFQVRVRENIHLGRGDWHAGYLEKATHQAGPRCRSDGSASRQDHAEGLHRDLAGRGGDQIQQKIQYSKPKYEEPG